MSLIYISQQMTIYSGWFLVTIGIIGNSLNIWIFSSVRTYRQTPSTFYFLSASIDHILYLTTILISRIFIAGYGIDLTRTSLVWCKTRLYLSSILSFISLTCSYLAALDQFLVTSTNVRLRHMSQIKWAHRIMFIVILFWILHGIPVLIVANITPTTNICMVTNNIYAIYIPIYTLSYNSFGLITFMTIFGYFTYHNIHTRRILIEQQADLQVVKMTLIQIILVAISIGPYGIFNAYALITSQISKNSDQSIKESFVSILFTLVTNVYYSGSFYMFFISSHRFRRELRKRVCFWQRTSQVIPLPNRTIERTNAKTNTRV